LLEKENQQMKKLVYEFKQHVDKQNKEIKLLENNLLVEVSNDCQCGYCDGHYCDCMYCSKNHEPQNSDTDDD
jgi:hypothetical protein